MLASVGAARARWLAELNAALEEAFRLVKLAEAMHEQSEILDLVLRIETVRQEIRSLQTRGRRMSVKFDPFWSRSSGSEEDRTGTA